MAKILKSVTLIKNDYTIDDIQSTDFQVREYKYSYSEYDQQGNMLADIKFLADGSVSDKSEYSFDEEGKLIEEIFYLDESEIAERKTYQRNEEGKILDLYLHYADGSSDITKYKYDDSGKLIEKLTIDSDDDIDKTEVFTYENEKLVLYRAFDADNELIAERSQKFDDKERLTELVEWEENVIDRTRTVEHYDEQGRSAEIIKYDENDHLLEKITYDYGSGNIPQKIIEERQNIKNEILLQYDDQGNMILQEEFDQDGILLTKVVRKYNEDKRVIESDVFIDGQGRYISQKYFIKYEYCYFE